jgi:hypothetical protein
MPKNSKGGHKQHKGGPSEKHKHYDGKGNGKFVRKAKSQKRGPHVNKYEGRRGQ